MNINKRRKRIFLALPLTVLIVLFGVVTMKSSDKTDTRYCDPYFTDCFETAIEEQPAVRRTVGAELTETKNSYDGFEMKSGASARLNEVTGIRYKAYVPETLRVKAAKGTVTLGFVIAPTDYFEAAEAYRVGDTPDYVKEFELLSANTSAVPVQPLYSLPVEENGAWIIQGSIATILYKNLNRSFSAVAFALEGGSYTYADYQTSNERSVSYVATAALNDPKMNYGDTEKGILQGIVNGGLDQAAGLNEEQSKAVGNRSFALSWRNTVDSLSVGDTKIFSVRTVVNYGEEDLLVTVPVCWCSSDESVLSVNENGEVTALKEGTVTLTAYVGEKSVVKEVTVQKALNCSIRDDSGYGLPSFSTTSATVSYGGDFQTTITLTDKAYGEVTVWIDEKSYTTSDGVLEFTSSVTADTQFVVESVATSFEYFSSTAVSTLKLDVSACPSKVILPKYTKSGSIYTKLASTAFPSDNDPKMQELIVPDSYTTFDYRVFKNCSALKTIKIYNTELASLTKAATWNANAPTTIYVPNEALSDYQNSKFWSSSGASIVGF